MSSMPTNLLAPRLRQCSGDVVWEPWTDKLWVYDLRTNQHFTLKQKPIQRRDFDEFVECYKPASIHKRKPTWNEDNPDGRWRSYDSEELLKRDKLSLATIYAAGLYSCAFLKAWRFAST
jgi:hypothetical protein